MDLGWAGGMEGRNVHEEGSYSVSLLSVLGQRAERILTNHSSLDLLFIVVTPNPHILSNRIPSCDYNLESSSRTPARPLATAHAHHAKEEELRCHHGSEESQQAAYTSEKG
jgi:hypothetical protein